LQSKRKYATLAFTAIWLATALVVATKRLIKVFPLPDAELNSDAYHVYLPNARKLLEAPWAFLTTDAHSYHVAPLGYVWSAVWGADHARIEFANCILFLLCIVLMWRCARRLGGLCAAAVATALLATSPMLEWVAQVLTEPIYLLGLMLCLHGGIEYALDGKRPRWMLAQFAAGLSITLLSRPILQFFALAAVLFTLGFMVFGKWHALKFSHTAKEKMIGSAAYLRSRQFFAALIAALLIPAAVVLKNGVYFDVWAIGTGAGTGLYYGVNPLRLGVEPVYSGFSYDASATPSIALSESHADPLARGTDKANAQIALNLVRNTTLGDNARFFAHKIKSWLFFSTQELHINANFRRNRTTQWLMIGMAAAVLLLRRRRTENRLDWPGGAHGQAQKLTITSLLLLLALAMAVQLAPVLYNMRYNLYAIEPWMLLLCGISAAILFQIPKIPPHLHGAVLAYGKWLLQKNAASWALACGVGNAQHLQIPARPLHASNAIGWHLKWLAQKAAIVATLALAVPALTGRAIRHETHTIDPYRPGPVQVLLSHENMGSMHAANAANLGAGRWELQNNPATLIVPMQIAEQQGEGLERHVDAVWRMRFAIDLQGRNARTCRQAHVQVSKARHISEIWYEPSAMLSLRPDGAAHTYAIHGNYGLRPSRDSELSLTFFCPPGTVVTWLGADLLKPALGEAARALLENATPIDPYYRKEPVP